MPQKPGMTPEDIRRLERLTGMKISPDGSVTNPYEQDEEESSGLAMRKPRDWAKTTALAAAAMRIGSGFLSGPPSIEPGLGTAIAGGIGGGGEYLAQRIESADPVDSTAVLTEAGLSVIPFGKWAKGATKLGSFARGAGLIEGGNMLRRYHQEGDFLPQTPGAAIWDALTSAGGGVGGLLGHGKVKTKLDSELVDVGATNRVGREDWRQAQIPKGTADAWDEVLIDHPENPREIGKLMRRGATEVDPVHKVEHMVTEAVTPKTNESPAALRVGRAQGKDYPGMPKTEGHLITKVSDEDVSDPLAKTYALDPNSKDSPRLQNVIKKIQLAYEQEVGKLDRTMLATDPDTQAKAFNAAQRREIAITKARVDEHRLIGAAAEALAKREEAADLAALKSSGGTDLRSRAESLGKAESIVDKNKEAAHKAQIAAEELLAAEKKAKLAQDAIKKAKAGKVATPFNVRESVNAETPRGKASATRTWQTPEDDDATKIRKALENAEKTAAPKAAPEPPPTKVDPNQAKQTIYRSKDKAQKDLGLSGRAGDVKSIGRGQWIIKYLDENPPEAPPVPKAPTPPPTTPPSGAGAAAGLPTNPTVGVDPTAPKPVVPPVVPEPNNTKTPGDIANAAAEKAQFAKDDAAAALAKEKPVTPKAPVAFTVTKANRQQLYDLGYTKADVDGMAPQQALDTIERGATKAKPSVTPPEAPPAAPVPVEPKPKGPAPAAPAAATPEVIPGQNYKLDQNGNKVPIGKVKAAESIPEAKAAKPVKGQTPNQKLMAENQAAKAKLAAETDAATRAEVKNWTSDELKRAAASTKDPRMKAILADELATRKGPDAPPEPPAGPAPVPVKPQPKGPAPKGGAAAPIAPKKSAKMTDVERAQARIDGRTVSYNNGQTFTTFKTAEEAQQALAVAKKNGFPAEVVKPMYTDAATVAPKPVAPKAEAPAAPKANDPVIVEMKNAGADKVARLRAEYEAKGHAVHVTENPDGTVNIKVTRGDAVQPGSITKAFLTNGSDADVVKAWHASEGHGDLRKLVDAELKTRDWIKKGADGTPRAPKTVAEVGPLKTPAPKTEPELPKTQSEAVRAATERAARDKKPYYVSKTGNIEAVGAEKPGGPHIRVEPDGRIYGSKNDLLREATAPTPKAAAPIAAKAVPTDPKKWSDMYLTNSLDGENGETVAKEIIRRYGRRDNPDAVALVAKAKDRLAKVASKVDGEDYSKWSIDDLKHVSGKLEERIKGGTSSKSDDRVAKQIQEELAKRPAPDAPAPAKPADTVGPKMGTDAPNAVAKASGSIDDVVKTDPKRGVVVAEGDPKNFEKDVKRLQEEGYHSIDFEKKTHPGGQEYVEITATRDVPRNAKVAVDTAGAKTAKEVKSRLLTTLRSYASKVDEAEKLAEEQGVGAKVGSITVDVPNGPSYNVGPGQVKGLIEKISKSPDGDWASIVSKGKTPTGDAIPYTTISGSKPSMATAADAERLLLKGVDVVDNEKLVGPTANTKDFTPKAANVVREVKHGDIPKEATHAVLITHEGKTVLLVSDNETALRSVAKEGLGVEKPDLQTLPEGKTWQDVVEWQVKKLGVKPDDFRVGTVGMDANPIAPLKPVVKAAAPIAAKPAKAPKLSAVETVTPQTGKGTAPIELTPKYKAPEPKPIADADKAAANAKGAPKGLNDLVIKEQEAWDEYHRLKAAHANGEATYEELRAAGKKGGELRAEVAKMAKELGEDAPTYARPAANPTKVKPPAGKVGRPKKIQDLPPVEQEKAADSIMDKLKKLANDESGEMTAEAAGNLGIAAFGAVTGAMATPDAPWIGGFIGGSVGMFAPSVLKSLNKHIDKLEGKAKVQATNATADWARDKMATAAAMLPEAYRFGLLSNVRGLAANAIVGPYGTMFMKGVELTLAGHPAGPKLMKLLASGDFVKRFASKATFAEAGEHLAHSNERAEITGKVGPPLFRKIVQAPAVAMTAGDSAARAMLMEAGLSEAEARAVTLTSEPVSGWGAGIGNFRKGKGRLNDKPSFALQMVLPFYRTNVNQIEQGLMRVPGVGHWLRGKWKVAPISVKEELMQQAVITPATVFVGYSLGALTPKKQQNMTLKFLSNFSGQYGTIATAAFLAGVAKQNGEDSWAGQTLSGLSGVVRRDSPLPTADIVFDSIDMLKKAQQGKWNEIQLPYGVVPGFLSSKDPVSIPSLLRDPKGFATPDGFMSNKVQPTKREHTLASPFIDPVNESRKTPGAVLQQDPIIKSDFQQQLERARKKRAAERKARKDAGKSY